MGGGSADVGTAALVVAAWAAVGALPGGAVLSLGVNGGPRYRAAARARAGAATPRAPATPGSASASRRQKRVRVVLDVQVGHLVLDHVVEDLRRRQQQAPVEAHRPARGAARPARALAADLERRVAAAGSRHRRVEPHGHLGARLAPIPGLERLSRVGARRQHHAELVAAPGDNGLVRPASALRFKIRRSPRYGIPPPCSICGRGTSLSDSRIRRSVRSIHGRFSWTNGSTFRRGKRRGTTTWTPSASTRMRA